ncbi:hypothetical protein PVAP13_1NG174038 [Panicum virgatum]|uniref:Uncharacterized protein n=1 Tax=Panicum virgatum TaxID=38727 RepID=A0A8T0WTC0_PANVG|nr:hypothetical protein PVAP13_1NG174038 [Panicum virgatum]
MGTKNSGWDLVGGRRQTPTERLGTSYNGDAPGRGMGGEGEGRSGRRLDVAASQLRARGDATASREAAGMRRAPPRAVAALPDHRQTGGRPITEGGKQVGTTPSGGGGRAAGTRATGRPRRGVEEDAPRGGGGRAAAAHAASRPRRRVEEDAPPDGRAAGWRRRSCRSGVGNGVRRRPPREEPRRGVREGEGAGEGEGRTGSLIWDL